MNLWILDSSEPTCRSGVHLHSHSASLRVLIIFCYLVDYYYYYFFTYACVSNTSGFVFGHIVLKCSCKFMFFVEFYNLIERAALQYDCGILSNLQCIIFVILFFWVS